MTEETFCVLEYAIFFFSCFCQAFRNRYGKKAQVTRIFCDGIGNLKIEVACAKRKAVAVHVSREKRWKG